MNLDKPLLADLYERETGGLIRKNHYGRFKKFEHLLMDYSIDLKNYTQITIILRLPACVERGFKNIPINWFLSQKSIDWYMQTRQQVSVNLLLPSAEAKQSEYQFALAYLEYKLAGGEDSEKMYLKYYCKRKGCWFNSEQERANLIYEVIGRLTRFGRFSTRKYCSTYDRVLEVYDGR